MKIVVSILVILVLAVGVYLIGKGAQMPQEAPIEEEMIEPGVYTSDAREISFVYPSNYFVVEHDLSTGERERYAIMLIEDTPGNRALVAGEVEGAEGPTAITIDIFQNNLDNYDADLFIENVSESNFKLATSDTFGTTVGGELGIGYSWSGLYEGTSVVVARPDWVYMFSVTHLTPNDEIIGEFQELLQTISFKKGGGVR